MSAAIPFMQYLRPDGRKRPTSIDRPDDIATKAIRIIAAGYRFEIEELTTGDVSMTIFDPDKGIDVAIEVCPNGLAVTASVDKLIKGFTP